MAFNVCSIGDIHRNIGYLRYIAHLPHHYFNTNYEAIFYCFQDIIAYFPKVKAVTYSDHAPFRDNLLCP